MDLDLAADGNLRKLSGEEAWESIENFAQVQKEWDNPPNIISKQELANLKAQAKRLFGNEDVWVEMHKGIDWDKLDTAYSSRLIRHIGNWSNALSCEVQALIRYIFLAGYDGAIFHWMKNDIGYGASNFHQKSSSNKAAESRIHGRNNGIDMHVSYTSSFE
ncbi:hypothetical protein Tco_0575013 [Tanacetum coccineum]